MISSHYYLHPLKPKGATSACRFKETPHNANLHRWTGLPSRRKCPSCVKAMRCIMCIAEGMVSEGVTKMVHGRGPYCERHGAVTA